MGEGAEEEQKTEKQGRWRGRGRGARRRRGAGGEQGREEEDREWRRARDGPQGDGAGKGKRVSNASAHMLETVGDEEASRGESRRGEEEKKQREFAPGLEMNGNRGSPSFLPFLPFPALPLRSKFASGCAARSATTTPSPSPSRTPPSLSSPVQPSAAQGRLEPPQFRREALCWLSCTMSPSFATPVRYSNSECFLFLLQGDCTVPMAKQIPVLQSMSQDNVCIAEQNILLIFPFSFLKLHVFGKVLNCLIGN